MAFEIQIGGGGPDSALAEFQAIEAQLRRIGFCETLCCLAGVVIGRVVKELGRDQASLLFERWVAAQALLEASGSVSVNQSPG